jgi:predicted amino acid-binding ACT domain protein
MSNAAARWKAVQQKLAKLDRAIDEVSQQRLICYLTDPLAFEHGELLHQREVVQQEMRDLAQQLNVTVLVPRTAGLVN